VDEKLTLDLTSAKALDAQVIDIDLVNINALPNTPLVIKCKRGIRARALVKQLREQGCANVYALRIE
jgi:rhodanese-related sulfurtransferase